MKTMVKEFKVLANRKLRQMEQLLLRHQPSGVKALKMAIFSTFSIIMYIYRIYSFKKVTCSVNTELNLVLFSIRLFNSSVLIRDFLSSLAVYFIL